MGARVEPHFVYQGFAPVPLQGAGWCIECKGRIDGSDLEKHRSYHAWADQLTNNHVFFCEVCR